jgi:hypothetical protein
MPSTYSDSLRIELIGKGEQAGTWDETTNENLGTLLEAAIAGHVEIALADANYSLTANNGSDDEARHASIKFTGTLTATRTITLPSLKSKMYIFENATNQSLVFDAGGTTLTVVAGDRVLAYVDNSGNVADQITSLAALKITSADIDVGTIDNTPIGGTTPAAGAFTNLSSTGNTTLGDASGDTLTVNAQAWSAPNGVLINTGLIDALAKISRSGVDMFNFERLTGNETRFSMYLNGALVNQLRSNGVSYINGGALAVGAEAAGFSTGTMGVLTKATSGSAFRAESSTQAVELACTATAAKLTTRTNIPIIFEVNTVETARLTSEKFFKASNTGVYGNTSGLADLTTNTSHNFQSNQNNSTLASINSNTGSTVSNYDSHLPTGADGNHFQGNINAVAVIRIRGNGDLQNQNNSYGAISDRKLKNLLSRKYGKGYYERFKQIQSWTYTLINDPTNQELLGVVAQELQDIFPGLVDSTPDTEEVEVTDEEGNKTTERRETGTVTLSVKYSVLCFISTMVTQELQFRIDDLTARIEALENK